MIFETHAHYDDKAFDEDRNELLKSLPGNGIEYVVNVGASMDSTRSSIELAAKYDFIYAAIGVHPSETGELSENDIEWLKKEALSNKKVVAIGEIGLDYYWDEPERNIQKIWFERQLELAREVKLPIIIHSRDAAKETLDIMKAHKAEELGGVVHCYSYSKEIAKEYLDMGFYFGIGGVVTFKNAKRLKEVVEYIPLDRILLETDSPYLSPEPNRGKRNSSLNIPYIASAIAQLKGVEYDELVNIAYQNAKDMYFKKLEQI